jgi:putative membrane protein
MSPAEEGVPDGAVPADRADRHAARGGPSRRPRSVYGVGSEPDPRYSLANERTALAWLRTALALVAGGVALTTVASFSEERVLLSGIAALACLAGGGVAVRALVGWRRTERAMRLALPLPAPSGLQLLVGGVALFAVALAGYVVVQALP